MTKALASWIVALAFLCGHVETALAATPSLAKAQREYRAKRYKKVIPLLRKALQEDPTAGEQERIYELMAKTHVVYGRTAKARDAYVRLLELKPDYEIPSNASPKTRKAFRQAKKRARRRTPESPAPAKVDAESTSDFDPYATSDTPLAARKDDDSVTIPAPDTSLETESDIEFYREWWFWTAVGVGAVGLGVGAALLFQPGEPDSDFGPFPLP